MDGDNDVTMVDVAMDLDLNLEPEPVSSGMPLRPFISQLESTQGRIEDRIRYLEEVTSRARQRQRWRQARNAVPESSTLAAFDLRGRTETGWGNWEESRGGGGGLERVERVGCKRDNSHLVARALEMDLDTKKDNGETGGFYDCNICLDMAKEPILTCCGHLFCWACFYQVSYVDSSAKECPVCKGEVTDASITPIYGNANNSHLVESETGLKIPPRPPAHRVESVRQQRVNRRISHIPVAEALRRIRISIGATADQPRQQNVNTATGEQQNLDTATATSDTTSTVLPTAEVGGMRRLRSRQFSRVLSESAASLSSISSALTNAERLVEDLESYIHGRLLRRTESQFLPVTRGDTVSSSVAVTQAELQTVVPTTETNLVVSLPSFSGTVDASPAVSETNAVIEGDLTMPQSSSSRRRSGARISDVDNGVSRESQRRRLR